MEKEKNFEESLTKLEEIIRELENGNISLDDSIKKYKDATELVEFCEEKLKDATETVNKIMKEDGSLAEFKENGE